MWRQNKITNVSKLFVYRMSKLTSWRFRYVKSDQHLLLEPSIDIQRELSCAPNINFIIYWTVKTFTIWEKELGSPFARRNRKLESRRIQM